MSTEIKKKAWRRYKTKANESKTQQELKPIVVTRFDELAEAGETLPDLKRVFGNYVLERNAVLFPSERGVGKTYFCLELAIAVSQCFPEFLGEPIDLHGNTLYINMELGDYIMQKRLSKLYKSIPKKESNPYSAYCITERSNLASFCEQMEVWIAEHKPVLVVIDNLRTAFSELDNERNKEMTKAIGVLNNLKDKYGFALVLVHHTKKGSSYLPTNSDMQSGAGAITDLIDGDMFLRNSMQDSSLRILKRIKSRNCEGQDGAKLIKFNSETQWFELIGDKVDEAEHIFMPNSFESELVESKREAKALRAEGKTFDEIGQILGKNKSTVSRWFKNDVA